jgi:ABC-type transporter MlaC component
MNQVYQPEQLDLIDEAFQQAWAELQSGSERIDLDPEVVKAIMRDKLLVLVDAGVVDVELMRKVALGTIQKYQRELSNVDRPKPDRREESKSPTRPQPS